ncbi:RKM5 [Sanghuangporus weigelae]
MIQDPTGLIRLPRSSVRVEDPEEEVFLLYTALSSRQPHDISSVSFPGLGSVDSKQDTITVRFTLPFKSTQSTPRPKGRQRRRQGRGQEQRQITSPEKSQPGDVTDVTWKHTPSCESAPSALESSGASHVSKAKKHDKSAKHGTSPKDGCKRAKSLVTGSNGEERTLEIELMQDKTALRSRRGDTGSVLWRVSVALGQALLEDFSSDSPYSLFDPEKLKSCNVLELGAGTGLLSLVFAPWVHHYTATDLDYLVPLIRKNVSTNLPVVQQAFRDTTHSKKYPTPSSSSSSKILKRATGFRRSEDSSNINANINIRRNESFFDPIQVTVEPLDWLELHRHRQRASPRHGSGGANSTTILTGRSNTAFRLAHADPPELIVIADCVYNPALIPCLLSAMEHYATPARTCVLVAVELRSADVVREFLESWAGLGGWEIWRVGRTAVGSRGSDADRESDGGGDADVHANDGWLGVDFAVWVGWKLEE